MDTLTAESIEIRVDTACQIEERLNVAVQNLQPIASGNRHGILVTRLGPGHYRICLSDEVPFGLTHEHSL